MTTKTDAADLERTLSAALDVLGGYARDGGSAEELYDAMCAALGGTVPGGLPEPSRTEWIWIVPKGHNVGMRDHGEILDQDDKRYVVTLGPWAKLETNDRTEAVAKVRELLGTP
jgi:hypothetical protein